MGSAYYNGGTGTIAWVDKAILGGNTYNFAAPVLTLTSPATATITKSASLIASTGGAATNNADVDAVVTAGLSPIAVTLANTGAGPSTNVRINPIGAGSHIQLWAKDTSGNWFNINVTGWIDSAGKSIPATSGPITTNVYAISDVAGSYPLTVNLVQVSNSLVVASTTGTITVNEPAPILTVNKVCNPAGDLGKFNLQIDGVNKTTDSICGGTSGPVVVSASSHTVGETAGSGTTLTRYNSVISGDCAANGTVTLVAGDNKTCTITNTVDTTPPTVTSVSSIINGATIYAIGTSLKFNSATTPNPHNTKVTFSENISNTPTIAVSGTSQTVTDCGDADAKTFCFAYTIPAATEYTTMTIQISGSKDAALNTMVSDNSHTFIVDTVIPQITVSSLISGTTLPTVNITNAAAYTLNGTYTELGSMSHMYWRVGRVLPLPNVSVGTDQSLVTAVTGTNVAWSHTWTNFFNTDLSGEGTFKVSSEVYDTAMNYGHIYYEGLYDLVTPTAIVAYDVTAPTSGSVIATITPSETVTGALTHTFTDNGSFTFNFTDLAGNPGSVVATVNNILIPDTTPDAFSFTDQTDVALSTVIESNTITVAGINVSADVWAGGAEYSKNDGAYTSTSGVVVSGDTVKVRHTSSASNSTAVNTTLTIGDVSDTFTSTTVAASNGGGGGGDVLSAATAPVCNDTKPGNAPVLLTAVAGFNSVTLTWAKAIDPTSYYLVTFGTKPGEQLYGNPNVGPAGTTSYTVKSLSGNTTYYFKVRAGNGCMPGDFSNELSARPQGQFITTPATDFEPGVLGTTTDATPSVTPSVSPSITPSVSETTPGILGTSTGNNNNNWWWLLLLIPLYFGGSLILKKK